MPAAKEMGLVAVTGAGSGIGLATVVELARRGVDVLATVEGEAMISDVRAATAGLTSSVEVEVLDLREIGDFAFPAELGVLVNNAGRRTEYLPTEAIAAEDWRSVFAVNVFGLVELTQRAIPVLRDGGGGVICNVTSSAVLDVAPFFGAYRASKAAVSALSETLRVELAPFGIRVVEIMPGPTHTRMAAGGVTSRLAEAVRYPPYAAMAHRQLEVHRELPPLTEPEDVAVTIVDAITDAHGPMRYGTDAVSVDRLRWWQGHDDETRMRQALERFLPEGP